MAVTRASPEIPILRQHLRSIADAALRAVSAESLTARAVGGQSWLLPLLTSGTSRPARLVVIAAGKPASAMVRGFLKGLGRQAISLYEAAFRRDEERRDAPEGGARYAGATPGGASQAEDLRTGTLAGVGLLEGVLRGMIATAHGGDDVPDALRLFVAGHPVPTAESVAAGRHALALAREAGPEDHLVVLLSGGASALLAAPADGLTLDDKMQATRALLAGGAAIHELNAVRKHLSAIKGGRLAAAARCAVHTFALSDVISPVDDDPGVIGSGPTVADTSTFAEALAAIDRLGVRAAMPRAAIDLLEAGVAGHGSESPKPGDPRLARASYTLIGSRRDAMAAARVEAERLGFTTFVIDEAISGEAREAAPRLLAQACALVADHGVPDGVSYRVADGVRYRDAHDDPSRDPSNDDQSDHRGDPGPKGVETPRRPAGRGPFCVIASGETTVRVTGTGKGGRNQEFALALAGALADVADVADEAGEAAGPATSRSRAGSPAPAPSRSLSGAPSRTPPPTAPRTSRIVPPFGVPIVAASIGTDGIDGPTDAAGGIVDPTTLRRARERGLGDPQAFLANNDAYRCLDALGDLIRTGPTDTNVGDLQIVLFGRAPA